MKADAITAKIIEDARTSAAQTLREANERADQMRKLADDETERKREETMRQAKAECGEMRDRMLRMAELDQRKAQLATKREVIDEAFQRALADMRAMPSDAMRAYVKRLLLDSAEGGEEIIVSAKDASFFDAQMLKDVNDALFKAGKMSVTVAGERRETDGGFILRRGGMEINCTFRAVLGQIRPSLEAEVAQMLFR